MSAFTDTIGHRHPEIVSAKSGVSGPNCRHYPVSPTCRQHLQLRQSHQFIPMEQSGLNAEANQKGLISGELHHSLTKRIRVKTKNNICLHSHKLLRFVVSNQKLSTLNIRSCHSCEVFFPKGFLREPRWLFIRGGEWRRPMEHCTYGYRAGVPGKVQTQGVYIHIVYLQTKVGSVLFWGH